MPSTTVKITGLPSHTDLLSLMTYLELAWGDKNDPVVQYTLTSLEQLDDDGLQTAHVLIKEDTTGSTTTTIQQFGRLSTLTQQIQNTPCEGCALQAQAVYSNDSPSQQQKKSKQKKKKKNKTRGGGEAAALASAFHQHLLDHPDLLAQAGDRDGTHVVFQKFLLQTTTSTTQQQCNNRTEALVMTKLRQQRKVKSKRRGDAVLMLYADADGTFPTSTFPANNVQNDRSSSKHHVRVLPAVLSGSSAQENKTVEVNNNSNPTTTMLVVPQREQAQSIDVGVVYDDDDYNNNAKQVRLESVEIMGPCARHFQLTTSFKEQLPLLLDSNNNQQNIQLCVTVPASRIGLLRASLHCRFVVQQQSKTTAFTIVRWIKVRAARAVNPAMDQVLQPSSPYQRKRRRRRGQTKPPEQVLSPPPPPQQDNKNNKDNDTNPFKSLPIHRIPNEVFNMLEAEEFEPVIEPWPSAKEEYEDNNNSNNNNNNNDAVTGKYGTFWKNLLWASEYQESQDIQLFDMENVQLQRQGRLFSLTVPGLAEKRPSVLRGDTVQVYWNQKLYKGRVEQVRLLEIAMQFHPSFHRNYSVATDRVELVRFTLSRMSFRLAHEACVTAETTLGASLLLPQSATGVAVPRSLGGQRLVWANRNLNQEQCCAVENIVWGSLRPLPYILFGPPGTGTCQTTLFSEYCCVGNG